MVEQMEEAEVAIVGLAISVEVRAGIVERIVDCRTEGLYEASEIFLRDRSVSIEVGGFVSNVDLEGEGEFGGQGMPGGCESYAGEADVV